MGKKRKYQIRDSVDKIDIEEAKKYILDNPNAKIFFGCDSTKFRKGGEWFARFITTIVVYEKDKNKIFGEISYERDFDKEPSRPQMRMMNEVAKTSAIVLNLMDILENREYEIHLDVNFLEMYGSNCAIQQAVGYIKGVHFIDPITKNDPSGSHPFAASCVADYLLKK